MRRALLLGCLSLTACRAALAPPATASLELEATIFDFGEVEKGTYATHWFAFRAAGAEPLRIHELKGSCGCTGGVVWLAGDHESAPARPYRLGEPIAVGRRGWIECQIDTNEIDDERWTMLEIASNDFRDPLHVRARVRVRPAYVVSPGTVELERAADGWRGRAALWSTGGTPIEVVEVACDEPRLAVSCRPLPEAADAECLELELWLPAAAAERFRSRVLLTFRDGKSAGFGVVAAVDERSTPTSAPARSGSTGRPEH